MEVGITQFRVYIGTGWHSYVVDGAYQSTFLLSNLEAWEMKGVHFHIQESNLIQEDFFFALASPNPNLFKACHAFVLYSLAPERPQLYIFVNYLRLGVD